MYVKPLGAVLQKADLISGEQIAIALQQQTQYEKKRLGEILASQGWIKQETANFFAEQWPSLVSEKSQQPLGQYLKKASLLNEAQIQAILSEQKRTGLRFGTLVALKGLIKQTTINFFVESLNLTNQSKLPYIENSDVSIEKEDVEKIHQKLIDNQQWDLVELLKLYRTILKQGEVATQDRSEQLELLKLNLVVQEENHLIANPIYKKVFNLDWVENTLIRLQPFERIRIELFGLDQKASSPYTLIEAILSWTSGQFFLTQKLCQLISESEVFINIGEENKIVNQFVQTYLLENWETQIGTELIKKIYDGLLRNQKCQAIQLLKLYREILKQGKVAANDKLEQLQLVQLGLVVKEENYLKVANRIYEKFFNLNWVENKLIALYPFNQFDNELLQLQKKASSPSSVLEEILSWTNGNIFLTQKLCQIINESEVFIPAAEENQIVEKLVQNYFLDNWETQINNIEPIRKIRDALQQAKSVQLLKLYQRILKEGEVAIQFQDKTEQVELLKLGLVIKENNYLKIANPIYEKIFNLNWIETQLAKIRPYLTTPTKSNSHNSKISIVAKKTRAEKPKLTALNVRFLLLLLLIPGVLLVGFNLLFRARLANKFQQGNELLKQSKYDQAIATYDQVLKMDNKSYQAWTNRGYALAGLGKYNEMLKSCSQAIEIKPKATYALNCQGEALQNLNRAELAMMAFDKAIAINPNDPVFWINKSESLLSLKRFDQALEMIDQAIDKLYGIKEIDSRQQINQELAIALTSKGRILAEKKLDQEALDFYNQALEYTPNYFSAQRGRGITLQALGKYDQAEANYQIMLDNPNLSDNQKAEIWFYRGLNFCQQRRIQAGVNAFDEALKLKPDYEAANSAKMTCNINPG